MRTSESIKEIAPALVKAQTEIKAAVKDATNPHFRSKYADLGNVIEAVRLPLNKAGITFLQPVSTSENGVSVETLLLHTSGEWVSETLDLPVSKNDAQGVGSAITYGRRYGLQSMCGVPAEDDDGQGAAKAAPTGMPAAAINPTTGLWDALDGEQQTRLSKIEKKAKEIISTGDIEAAVNFIAEAAIDGADEKAALWSRFDSKARSAMKRAQQELAMRPPHNALATQA